METKETYLPMTLFDSSKKRKPILDPLPPPGRLYLFTKTAQVIRLEKISHVVLIQDLETGQKSELKLVEFVKQVQSGTWLLKPRSENQAG